MRWFRRGAGKQPVEHDPGVQQALLHDVRERFGPQIQARFPDQVAAADRLLDGDDGIAVAAAVLREFADAAHADLNAQAAPRGYVVNRRNYRPLWKKAAGELQWPLFGLPAGYHPYIQVSAAATAVSRQAKRVVRVTDPAPLLAHLFEVLDLTIAGWEFARVRVDIDGATLADRLIAAGRDVNAALDEPPPLPPPVRELMRSNRSVEVHDSTANRVVGTFNPGKQMREALLA